MDDRHEPPQEQPQPDDFDRMPPNTWQLFPRHLTATSLTVFRRSHPKFSKACQIELDRYNGEDFFSFLFKVPKEQILPIFVRLAEIINQYFQLELSPAEYLMSCERFIRDNQHYAQCLDFQQRLIPAQRSQNKLYRQNAFIGSITSLFLDPQQISIILTLLTYRCQSKTIPFCEKVASAALLVKDDNPTEQERLTNLFLSCIAELQTAKENSDKSNASPRK